MKERNPHPLATYVFRPDYQYERYLEAQSHFDYLAEDIDQSVAKLAFSNAEIAAIQSGDMERFSSEIVEGLDELKSEINSGFNQISVGIDEINQELRNITNSVDEVRNAVETGFAQTLKQLEAIEKVLKDILGTLQSPERTWAFEMYSIAKELYARGKDMEALEYLGDAINGNGNNRGYKFDSKIHLFKGKILLGRMGTPSQSIIDLPKAREAFDIAADYSFPTKEQIAESGMPPEQLIFPYYDAVCSSAWASYCMGDYISARLSYEKAILQCPLKSRAYYFLGKVFAHLGKRKPAILNFECAIRINHVRAASALLDGDYLNFTGDLAKCIDTVRVERIEKAKDSAKFILTVRSDAEVWKLLVHGQFENTAEDCKRVISGDSSLSEISTSLSAIVIVAKGTKKSARANRETLAQEVSGLSSSTIKGDTSPSGVNWDEEMTGFRGAWVWVVVAHVGLAVLLIALAWIILPLTNHYPFPKLSYSWPVAWNFITSIYGWVIAAAVILPFLIPFIKDNAEESLNEAREDDRIKSVRAQLNPKTNLLNKLDALLKVAPS